MANERAHGTTGALKDLMWTRGLRPGDPMPTEAELMRELDVSRSSVREAVRTLVALDILEVRHGTGTFVGAMSLRPLVEAVAFRGMLDRTTGLATLRDVVELRMGLDFSIAERVVSAIAGSDTTELRVHTDAMTQAARRDQRFTAADRRFHQLLADSTGNQLYGELVGAFWVIHQAMTPLLSTVTRRDLASSAAAHAELLAAAEAGDVGRYRAAIEEHYAPLRRILDELAPTAAPHAGGAAASPLPH